MKAIVIGDIHGRDSWIKIVEQNPDADLFIFVGDYFDSLTIPALKQINNFKLILKFRDENPNKVIMLFGNHDFHYTSGCIGGGYTGFDFSVYYNVKLDLERLIREEVIKVCHLLDDIFFSHAGITKTWCENNNINLNNVEEDVNQLLIYRPYMFAFTPGIRRDKYGDDITQGPLWVREQSLKEDGLKDYIHVVGHSRSEEIIFNLSEAETNYIIVDTLGNNKYLEIIISDDGNKLFNSKEIF
jgi:hypothetical protein